ncbi:N-acetylmuramoyl-L-alanine amidase [Bacillus megaterium]|jgi:N-acetylmuramoyl-L-alanine amidase|nr:N-acetylmuramoyl-L-alanine amidase [Priestia megaterium NBRC 15308 = ATCC 14581]NGY84893.1 N-acetylmuramoyl-L-alanine amidase [Priestia megaterium]NGY84959.1 N-acetylmuramoyl-L-alanine amidase [Priestia megaterium]
MVKIVKDYLKVNPYTRPARKNYGVKGIVMHYTATPRASAKNERDYFNGTCIALKRYASAHYFVDKNEIRQIIPDNEVAYHAHDRSRCYVEALANNANFTALGVEMCIEADGSLHPNTIKNAIELVAYLCNKYGLPTSKIYRHYDVTEKNCPAMWVSKPCDFVEFKDDVYEVIKGAPAPAKPVQPNGLVTFNPVRVVRTKTDIWTQEKPNFSPDRRVKKLPKDTEWKAYGLIGDYYSLGSQYVHKAYVEEVGLALKAPSGIIKFGDKGDAVEDLQECLNAVNFKLKGRVDGIFGNDTLQALKRFQAVYANPADGIYGAKTREALQKELNKQ